MPGPESERLFTNHYKKLNKVIDQNFSTETPNSHLTNMLLVQEKYRILPSKLGLVKTPKALNSVQLKYIRFCLGLCWNFYIYVFVSFFILHFYTLHFYVYTLHFALVTNSNFKYGSKNIEALSFGQNLLTNLNQF